MAANCPRRRGEALTEGLILLGAAKLGLPLGGKDVIEEGKALRAKKQARRRGNDYNVERGDGNNNSVERGGNNHGVERGGNNYDLKRSGNNHGVGRGGNKYDLKRGGNNHGVKSGGNNYVLGRRGASTAHLKDEDSKNESIIDSVVRSPRIT